MSWPTDGRPRYVVSAVEGTLEPLVGGGKSPAPAMPMSVSILDRAFCHRQVATWRGDNVQRGGHRGRTQSLINAEILGLARERCAQLNASVAVAA